MPSVSELVEDVAEAMDEPIGTVSAYARALIDAGELPKSRGRAVAQVSYRDIATQFTAVTLEPKVKDTATVVAKYLSLPNNIDFISDPKPQRPFSAGDWLESFIVTSLHKRRNPRHSEWWEMSLEEIIFVKCRPEMRVRGHRGNIRYQFSNHFRGLVPILRTSSIYGLSFQRLGSKSGRYYNDMEEI